MPLHDSDISWQLLRRIVHEWAGTSAELAEVRPLDGGCINTTLALTTSQNDRAVLKISQHRINREFEQEAHQLDLLRARGIPTPAVYAQKTATLEAPESYILMEYVDGVDLAEARRRCDGKQFDALQTELAEIVARLHQTRGDSYQRVLPGETSSFDAWPAFYRSIYDPIWHEASKAPHLSVKSRRQIDRIHERIEETLANADGPRLVHWDIWSTNLLCKQNDAGQWKLVAVLDPNCKYAHAEAEIAYMELFNTVTPTFLKAYGKLHPLPEEYHRARKWIYQLYPLIDHVLLFGEQYLKPLATTLERISTNN